MIQNEIREGNNDSMVDHEWLDWRILDNKKKLRDVDSPSKCIKAIDRVQPRHLRLGLIIKRSRRDNKRLHILNGFISGYNDVNDTAHFGATFTYVLECLLQSFNFLHIFHFKIMLIRCKIIDTEIKHFK